MTSRETALAPTRLLELGRAFMASRLLQTAVALDVFSTLSRGPLDVDQLSGRLGLHPRGARDFLDALVAAGLLERAGRAYANTPESDRFLDRAKPAYVGAAIEQQALVGYPAWVGLGEALRSGRPHRSSPERARETDDWAERYRDPDYLRVFPRAMTAACQGWAGALARAFPWRRYRTFADIGTAAGGLPVQLALAHPHLRGVGFDLPPVRPLFEEYVAWFRLADRLRFEPGDFFVDSLPEADVLVMGAILHSWGPEQRLRLLRSAHLALPRGGALIVREQFIDDARCTNMPGLLMSLSMLLDSEAGRNFTAAECQAWLGEAGFRDSYVDALTGPSSMVVGLK